MLDGNKLYRKIQSREGIDNIDMGGVEILNQ